MARTKAVVLAQLRKHKHFAVLAETVKVDLNEWRYHAVDGEEEYEGEAAERAESYALLLELLTGKRGG